MKSLKEYINLKKFFIQDKDLDSNNIYDFLNENQIKVIQKYYGIYTKFLFKRLMGSLRLQVSPSKAKKLIELKGSGMWEFAGMVDMRVRGAATCELGHPLRYVYYAQNVTNGEILQFGSRCVGDFFSIDDEGIKALSKVKEVMFNEMKELVAISYLNLYKEHYLYDCGDLGKFLFYIGIDNLDKIEKYNSLLDMVRSFISVNLPLPMSLIEQINQSNISFEDVISQLDLYGINVDMLEYLQKSSITIISKMFKNSEQDIKNLIKKGKIKEGISDFYNFRSVSDLQEAINIWGQREKLLQETHSFFKSKGLKCNWMELYKLAIKENFNRDDIVLDRGLRILSLFDVGIDVQQSFYVPYRYSFAGYSLDENIEDDFDNIIASFASKSFIMPVIELINRKRDIDKKIEEVEENNAIMMVYLREHLPMDKYDNIRGINGIRDIVLNKNMKYQDMSEKQYNFVSSVYSYMLDLDKSQGKKEKDVSDSDINNRYTLSERPDILAKIQRLQNEVADRLNSERPKVSSIMETVLKTQRVSDKQIRYINEAFSEYILGEQVVKVESNMPLSVSKPENRKWNLIERPDIQEKVTALINHPEFNNMYSATQSILKNILKYNSVSEKQIESVERVYRKYFNK